MAWHDLVTQRQERLTAVGHHLASEQVQALDAGRAFVDAVELLVAKPRLWQVLARVAVAAVDLQRQSVGLEAALRRGTSWLPA